MEQDPTRQDLAQDPTYTALDLAELQACHQYRTFRNKMVTLAGTAASLCQLALEQPHRPDYQQAWRDAVLAQSRAMTQTGRAYTTWQRARRRTDAAAPAPALAVQFSASGEADGEVA